MSSGKKITYSVVVGVLVVATGVVLYQNFVAPMTQRIMTPPDTSSAVSAVESDGVEASYQTGELDFLESAKFRRLRAVGEPILLDGERSTNPFSATP